MNTNKTLKYVATVALVFVPIGYFFPVAAAIYALCGLYDVSRNDGLGADLMRRYFLGNGVPTWLLSPFNALLDILSLPYLNRGVYRIEDLPAPHQDEVRRLIAVARDANLVGELAARAQDHERTMIFFKWYGTNVETFLDVPAFREKWKYVQTIGVSVFNKRSVTNMHFGPLRMTLRVLYSLHDLDDDSAYIVVGNTINHSRGNKLFIFDDTLIHQSCNLGDAPRYCLFVDILRPSPLPGVLRQIVRLIRVGTRGFNHVYYRHWKIIDR